MSNQNPRRTDRRLPTVRSLRTNGSLGAPTGNVERWLVCHKQTDGVLSIVHDYYWFAARARAEWVHKMPRDDLALKHMPYLPGERGGKLPMNAFQLAAALGMKMHAEVVVAHVDHMAGVITAGPRRCGMTFSYNDEPDRLLTCARPATHAGEHRPFSGLGCRESGCRREEHLGDHQGIDGRRWKNSSGKKR